ncbi:orn protein [Paraphysoderma sedebokerense]|nr:orn protein [Paraphysoderma sedebokerense]
MVKNPMVWIDCEMTGLNHLSDVILEIAVLITDGDLNIVAEGPNVIIHHPETTMNNMSEWCIQHHGASGLTKSVLDSKIIMKEAEDMVMTFLSKWVKKGEAVLAGNSVHADKKFLEKDMPRITDYLHYRIIDVSTVKELTRRWYPDVFEGMRKKKGAHRALDDIKESIEELKFYRGTVFRQRT